MLLPSHGCPSPRHWAGSYARRGQAEPGAGGGGAFQLLREQSEAVLPDGAPKDLLQRFPSCFPTRAARSVKTTG